MNRRVTPPATLCLVFALPVLTNSNVLLAGEQPGRPQLPAVGSGVVSLDVYAQDATLDLLTTTREGETLELSHQRSRDGGKSWGTSHVINIHQPISIARRGNEPQVVAHREHVVVHWSTHGESRFGAGPMASTVSHDAGRTWTPGQNPTGNKANTAQNFSDMTADPDGNFYVAWIGSHDEDLAGRGLGVSRSTDFGETWEFSQLVDTSSCACCWNKMIAPRPGQVHVLYRDHNIRDMALASTNDTGEHWELTSPVGEFNWEFPGCPHVGGGIAVTQHRGEEQLHALVWTGHEKSPGLFWVRSTDGGNSWNERRPHRMGGELARHADLGSSGRTLVAAWDETRAIWLSTSHDEGTSWSEPHRVSTQDASASHPVVIHTGKDFLVFWTYREASGRLQWRSYVLGTHDETSSQR